ncbi:hypothetical protein APHAL10511_003941 [Amanita phalloides]|nr:hypothetical protein APHAL10511_003941 [Amanita phalloides]
MDLSKARPPPDAHHDLPPAKKPRTSAPDAKQKDKKKLRKKELELPDRYSAEGVLWQDMVSILGEDVVDKAIQDGTSFNNPYEYDDILDVNIVSLSSTGEAIGLATGTKRRPWIIVTRFCVPGETVRVRVYWNRMLHSYAHLIDVNTPNLQLRDNDRIKCQYFGKCGGCQYQMLSYEQQLKLKRDVIVKAYKSCSDLPESSIPVIQDTIPSPLEYGYRTKLTPHFDAPPKPYRFQKAEVKDGVVQKPEWFRIGFNIAGTHKVLDIEECPISTPTLNNALPSVRENIYRNLHTYAKGVSLTLRDSLVIPSPDSIPSPSSAAPEPDPVDQLTTSLDHHICISNPKGTVREKVGDWIFEYGASSFFQNNNSILKPLTDYVRDAIFPSSSSRTPPTHLVDAYCGSGLFSITLSPYFGHIAGIELAPESIKAAKHNAQINHIPSTKISYRAGDAADVFAVVRRDFEPAKTVLVIDPPRKGCDDNFIKQLLSFRCATVVYVSCNVHTQARDVGRLVSGTERDREGRRYVVESLRGFDLFPQTAHVEGVAVLRLV